MIKIILTSYIITQKRSDLNCHCLAARHQGDVLEEEPGAANEAEEENVAEAGQRVEFDDKMGAKVN